MERIKAHIRGEGVHSSVEFSVEELIADRRGKPWGELSDAEREAEMEDYARFLFTRDSGVGGELSVRLESAAHARDVAATEAGRSTQSDHSLSQEADEGDGRYTVAEEVSFDQQSDQMRHVGRMPPGGVPGTDAADAMGKAVKRD